MSSNSSRGIQTCLTFDREYTETRDLEFVEGEIRVDHSSFNKKEFRSFTSVLEGKVNIKIFCKFQQILLNIKTVNLDRVCFEINQSKNVRYKFQLYKTTIPVNHQFLKHPP